MPADKSDSYGKVCRELTLSLKNVRALIVEDNDTSREFLQQQLLSWGMSSDGAGDGLLALEMLRSASERGAPYGIALVDQSMPGMSGSELCRKIKADPALKSVALVLMTFVGERGDLPVLGTGDVSACITKPVSQSELHDCLVRVLDPNQADPICSGAARMEGAPQGQKARPQRHILVAEDNHVNQMVIAAMLESLGCTADMAENGVEVLCAFVGGQYDLILMDCEMPQMDGYTATREIRRREAEKSLGDAAGGRASVPIVALTAHAMEGSREKCISSGMDDYLSKPVSLEELKAVLDRWSPGAGPEEAICGCREPVPEGPGIVAPGSGPAAGGVPDGEERARHARILVVDDSNEILEVARAMLEHLGYTVDVATDGFAAVQAVQAYGGAGYDLIFMDCNMPKVDGYEATKIIRRRESESREGVGGAKEAHVPIISLTGNDPDDYRVRGKACGMDDQLTKPFTFSKLKAVLEKWLPHASSDR